MNGPASEEDLREDLDTRERIQPALRGHRHRRRRRRRGGTRVQGRGRGRRRDPTQRRAGGRVGTSGVRPGTASRVHRVCRVRLRLARMSLPPPSVAANCTPPSSSKRGGSRGGRPWHCSRRPPPPRQSEYAVSFPGQMTGRSRECKGEGVCVGRQDTTGQDMTGQGESVLPLPSRPRSTSTASTAASPCVQSSTCRLPSFLGEKKPSFSDAISQWPSTVGSSSTFAKHNLEIRKTNLSTQYACLCDCHRQVVFVVVIVCQLFAFMRLA